jgi:hypothetical protein
MTQTFYRFSAVLSLLLAASQAYGENLVLRTSETRITVPLPANDWLAAVPGPLTSPQTIENSFSGHDPDEVYGADRKLHSHQEAISQMYAQAGRVDSFLLHQLIFRKPQGLAVDFDGSTYVGTGNGQMGHAGGPDLMQERENMIPPQMIIPEDTGSALYAGPEIPGQNFRPSIHVAIAPASPMGSTEKTPHNSADVVTRHLGQLRAIYGANLINIGERQVIELAGENFITIAVTYDRNGLPIYQWQAHRKQGDRHILIEATASSSNELEALKSCVNQVEINALR